MCVAVLERDHLEGDALELVAQDSEIPAYRHHSTRGHFDAVDAHGQDVSRLHALDVDGAGGRIESLLPVDPAERSIGRLDLITEAVRRLEHEALTGLDASHGCGVGGQAEDALVSGYPDHSGPPFREEETRGVAVTQSPWILRRHGAQDVGRDMSAN